MPQIKASPCWNKSFYVLSNALPDNRGSNTGLMGSYIDCNA